MSTLISVTAFPPPSAGKCFPSTGSILYFSSRWPIITYLKSQSPFFWNFEIPYNMEITNEVLLVYCLSQTNLRVFSRLSQGAVFCAIQFFMKVTSVKMHKTRHFHQTNSDYK